jgi:hypothetical protein
MQPRNLSVFTSVDEDGAVSRRVTRRGHLASVAS